MISNWDFSLVLAISELLVDPQQPSSLLDIKLHAFQKAKDLMLQYEKRGIRRDLLDVILDKKLKLILKAETANEVKRASEPPKPVYNYGTWREDPFSVPEEELAMWAIISPNNMLIQPAQERYMDLFITRRVIPTGSIISLLWIALLRITTTRIWRHSTSISWSIS